MNDSLNGSKTSSDLKSKVQDILMEKFTQGASPSSSTTPEPVERIDSEILNYLDQLSGTTFDRETGNMIFEQCGQTTLGDVNIKDFVEKYGQGVLLARRKIIMMKDSIEAKKKKLHEFRMRSDEVKEKDKQKPKGRLSADGDRDILVIKANEIDGFNGLEAKNVYLTFTMDSVTKKTKPYLLLPNVQVNEFVDFELKRDSKYFTVFLYKDTQEGQYWTATQDVNIADMAKGWMEGKQVSVELMDVNKKYLSGRGG